MQFALLFCFFIKIYTANDCNNQKLYILKMISAGFGMAKIGSYFFLNTSACAHVGSVLPVNMGTKINMLCLCMRSETGKHYLYLCRLKPALVLSGPWTAKLIKSFFGFSIKNFLTSQGAKMYLFLVSTFLTLCDLILLFRTW